MAFSNLMFRFAESLRLRVRGVDRGISDLRSTCIYQLGCDSLTKILNRTRQQVAIPRMQNSYPRCKLLD